MPYHKLTDSFEQHLKVVMPASLESLLFIISNEDFRMLDQVIYQEDCNSLRYMAVDPIARAMFMYALTSFLMIQKHFSYFALPISRRLIVEEYSYFLLVTLGNSVGKFPECSIERMPEDSTSRILSRIVNGKNRWTSNWPCFLWQYYNQAPSSRAGSLSVMVQNSAEALLHYILRLITWNE